MLSCLGVADTSHISLMVCWLKINFIVVVVVVVVLVGVFLSLIGVTESQLGFYCLFIGQKLDIMIYRYILNEVNW